VGADLDNTVADNPNFIGKTRPYSAEYYSWIFILIPDNPLERIALSIGLKACS
jgi:hypothetical protein